MSKVCDHPKVSIVKQLLRELAVELEQSQNGNVEAAKIASFNSRRAYAALDQLARLR